MVEWEDSCARRKGWHRGSAAGLVRKLKWDALPFANLRHWGYTDWWVCPAPTVSDSYSSNIVIHGQTHRVCAQSTHVSIYSTSVHNSIPNLPQTSSVHHCHKHLQYTVCHEHPQDQVPQHRSPQLSTMHCVPKGLSHRDAAARGAAVHLAGVLPDAAGAGGSQRPGAERAAGRALLRGGRLPDAGRALGRPVSGAAAVHFPQGSLAGLLLEPAI